MSYYLKLRDTIHGIDKLIASAIHQSVTMITASLTLGVILYEKLGDLLNSTILALLLTIAAFWITLNAKRRIRFYSEMLNQTVKAAGDLEDLLISSDEVKITRQIQKKVKYSAIGGVNIYLASSHVFYVIEAALFIYFSVNAILMLWRGTL
jgi:hypothetical protein